MFVSAPQSIELFGVSPFEAMLVLVVSAVIACVIAGVDRRVIGLAASVSLLGVLLHGTAAVAG